MRYETERRNNVNVIRPVLGGLLFLFAADIVHDVAYDHLSPQSSPAEQMSQCESASMKTVTLTWSNSSDVNPVQLIRRAYYAQHPNIAPTTTPRPDNNCP